MHCDRSHNVCGGGHGCVRTPADTGPGPGEPPDNPTAGAHLAPKPRGPVQGARSSPHRPLACTNGPEADQDRGQGPGTGTGEEQRPRPSLEGTRRRPQRTPATSRRSPAHAPGLISPQSAALADSPAATGGSLRPAGPAPPPAGPAPPCRPSQPRRQGAGLGLSSPEAAAGSAPRVGPALPHSPPPAAGARRPARSADPAPACPVIGARPALPSRPESSS